MDAASMPSVSASGTKGTARSVCPSRKVPSARNSGSSSPVEIVVTGRIYSPSTVRL